MTDMLPDIPRLYTALAEWASCLVYIFIAHRGAYRFRFFAGAALALVLQCAIQLFAGFLPLFFWIPGMALAAGGMYLFIFFAAGLSAYNAGYYCARAFILAEFAASLEWQLYCYFFSAGTSDITLTGAGFMLPVYALVFIVIYVIEARQKQKYGRFYASLKEIWSAAGIALAVFAISNISFITSNTPFSSRLIRELFYIRTLVDFCGLAILHAYQEQHRELRLNYELKAVQNILHRQYEQFRQSEESIAFINRKYHDLKHQVSVIRAETDPEKRSSYLSEIEKGIDIYEAQYKTGNTVLDTILMTKSLLCAKQHITLTCVANGAVLDFMNVMDVCTIFGNALDNAIEAVMKLQDPQKRLIRLALYAQNNFVMICFENCYDSALKAEGGLSRNPKSALLAALPSDLPPGWPETTKDDTGYHGFGLKSIRYTAEKYNGTITIHTENDWFILRVLVPRT
jgi:hypothetical protein